MLAAQPQRMYLTHYGAVGEDALDVDAYVTTKTLDGLFKMIAVEEKNLRENPAARTTDLLKQVFGAVGK